MRWRGRGELESQKCIAEEEGSREKENDGGGNKETVE